MGLPAAIIAAGALAGGASMYSAHQQKKSAEKSYEQQKKDMKKAEAKQIAAYEQQKKDIAEAAVYPTREEVSTQEKTYTGKLGQQRLGSYQSLAAELASRGFGAGGGYGEGRAENIEKGYAGGLSDLYRNLISFANTPKYVKGVAGQPDYASFVTQSPVTQSSGAAGISSISDMMSKAAGYMMLSQMLQGGGGGGNQDYRYMLGYPGSSTVPGWGPTPGGGYGIS